MRIIGDGDGHAYPINESNAWRRFVNAMSKRGSQILQSRMAFHGLHPHLEKRHFMHEQRSSVIRKENLFSLREPRSTSMADDTRAMNERYMIAGWHRFQERSSFSCLPELNLSLGLKSTIWWLCNARPKSFEFLLGISRSVHNFQI